MNAGNHFDNILAVVNWRDDGDGCFLSAIQLANKFCSHLHVLCLRQFDDTENSKDRNHFDNTKIWTLRTTYRHLLAEQLSLHIHIMREFSRNMLISYIARNRIELTVLWKRSGCFFPTVDAWIYANWLSRKAVCSVLSLSGHRERQIFRNIILPVENGLPAGKLILALQLAGAFKAKIHLVSVANREGQGAEDKFFLRACQLLQYHRNLEVECKMLVGMSFTISILNYVNRVNADLVVVCASRKALASGVVGLLSSGRHAMSGVSFMIMPTDRLNIQ